MAVFSSNFLPVECVQDTCPAFKTCQRMKTEVHRSDPEQPVDILFVVDSGHSYQDDAHAGVFFGNRESLGGRMFRNLVRGASKKVTWAVTGLSRTITDDDIKPYSLEKIIKIKSLCHTYFKKDLDLLKPKVIVPIGTDVWKFFSPDGQPITKARGNFHTVPNYSAKVFPVISPAAVQNNVAMVGTLLEDFAVLMGKVPELVPVKGKSYLLSTLPEVMEYLDFVQNEAEYLAVDTETLNLNKRYGNKMATIQFAYSRDEAAVIPYQHLESPFDPGELEQIRKRMIRLFTEPQPGKYFIMHNTTFDAHIALAILGCHITSRPILDTMAFAYLRDENRVKFGDGALRLKQLASEYLQHTDYDKEAIEARSGGSLFFLALNKLAIYGGMDAWVTYALFERLKELCDASTYKDIHRLLEHFFSPVYKMITFMEHNGIFVDIDHLRYLTRDDGPIWNRVREIEAEIWDMESVKKANALIQSERQKKSGMRPLFETRTPDEIKVFHINKAESRRTLFVDVLGLDAEYDEDTGNFSFGKTFQDLYKDTIPEVELFNEYQAMNKLATSYTRNIHAFVDPAGATEDVVISKDAVTGKHTTKKQLVYIDNATDGRIRPSLRLTTSTGRGRMSNPNLQQVPRADNLAKKQIKSMFIASPGTILGQLDYKASEVRWWAIISKDPELAEVFNRGKRYRDAYIKLANEMPRADYINLQTLATSHKQIIKSGIVVTPEEVALDLDLDWKTLGPIYQAWDDAEYIGDVHINTAAKMFGVDLRKVTKNQRTSAKSIVFGAMFGRSPRSIGMQIGKPEVEAQKEIDKFFSQFKVADQWLKNADKFADKNFYIRSDLGRRRRFYQYYLTDYKAHAQARRQARNSPIQSISSDGAFLGAALFYEYILQNGLQDRWLIQNAVHDSCVSQFPPEELATALRVAEKCFTHDVMDYMTKHWGLEFNCEIEVEFEIGTKWGFIEKWDGTVHHLDLLLEKCRERKI